MMSLRTATLAEPKPRPESNFLILKSRLMETRALSTELAAPLSDEDQVVQAMDDASPTKWHLAHTTWFFEAFLLKRFLPGYRAFVDESLGHLFDHDLAPDAAELVELGVNHEQQHQELLLTDILALFASEPLKPAYRQASPGVAVGDT